MYDAASAVLDGQSFCDGVIIKCFDKVSDNINCLCISAAVQCANCRVIHIFTADTIGYIKIH